MTNVTEVVISAVDKPPSNPSFWMIFGITLLTSAIFSGVILAIGCWACRGNKTSKQKGKSKRTRQLGKREKTKSSETYIAPGSVYNDTGSGMIDELMRQEGLVTERVQPSGDNGGGQPLKQGSIHRSYENVLKANMYLSTMSLPAESNTMSTRDLSTPGSREGNAFHHIPPRSLSVSCQQLPTAQDSITAESSGVFADTSLDASGFVSQRHSTPGPATPGPAITDRPGSGSLRHRDDVDYELGTLKFRLQYAVQKNVVAVRVISATSLPKKDFIGTSDPYVKIALLPDKARISTTIKRDNLNPQWNEDFEFKGIAVEKVLTRSVHFRVFDFDRIGRDNFIGELYVELGKVGIAHLRKGVTLQRYIKPCLDGIPINGKILISLCYEPMKESIIVGVIKCESLETRARGDPECSVKIRMLAKKKKISKKLSLPVKSENPVFNQSFQFPLNSVKLGELSFVIKVLDRNQRGSNQQIGSVTLGPKSTPTAVKHWNEMFKRSYNSVAAWHTLYMQAK